MKKPPVHTTRFFFFLFLCFCFIVSAQNKKADSLFALLKTKTDTSRVRVLLRLSTLIRQSDPKRAEILAREAIDSAKKLHNAYFTAHGLSILGNAFIIQGEFDSAIARHCEALKLFASKDYYGRGSSNNNIALCFFSKGDYKNAVVYALEGEKINETAKDTAGMIGSYNTIANIYLVQKDFDKALSYYSKNLELASRAGNDYIEGVALNNIGSVYAEMKQPEKAVEFFLKAMEKRKNNNDIKGLSGSMMNAGIMYRELKKSAEAKKFLTEALELKIKVGDKNGIITCNANLGDLYLALKENKKALEFMQAAEKLLNENPGDDAKLTVYGGLASAYEAMGDVNNALKYFKLKTMAGDSIFSFEKSREIAGLQVKFETEKKEKENKILKQENELAQLKLNESKNRTLILYGGLLLSLIVLGAVAYAFILKARTNKILSSQNERINRQNATLKSLNTQLIESEESLRVADSTKDKLLKIISHDINSPLKAVGNYRRMLLENIEQFSAEELREALKKINNSHEPVEYLVDNLMHWIMLQRDKIETGKEKISLKLLADETLKLFKLQAENKKISFSSGIAENAEIISDENLLKLILRNLAANAIKFTGPGGKVEIDFDNDSRTLSVKDSGEGMSETTIQKILSGETVSSQTGTGGEEGTGLGLQLVTSAVKMMHAEMKIISTKGKGTEFRIRFSGE